MSRALQPSGHGQSARGQSSSTTRPDRHGIYLHFEMGLSWRTRTGRASAHRQLHYPARTSRAIERPAHGQRQLPPPNTNFLAGQGHQVDPRYQYYYTQPHHATHQTQQHYQHPANQQNHFQYHQAQHPPTHHRGAVVPPQDHSHYRSQYQHQPQHQTLNLNLNHDQMLRPDARSRPTYERGHSAPPPCSDRPWDAEPEPMTSTALPRRQSRPHIWKTVPADPSEFRLGESSMPWSQPLYAPGFVEGEEIDITPVQPSVVQVVDDRERVRTKEMQSLASALMTVDNGFEDQWWYQGSRLVNIAGDLITPAALAERYESEGMLSWAGPTNETPTRAMSDIYSPATPMRSAVNDIVSPISAVSSPDLDHPALQRSLTTRSEELHIR